MPATRLEPKPTPIEEAKAAQLALLDLGLVEEATALWEMIEAAEANRPHAIVVTSAVLAFCLA